MTEERMKQLRRMANPTATLAGADYTPGLRVALNEALDEITAQREEYAAGIQARNEAMEAMEERQWKCHGCGEMVTGRRTPYMAGGVECGHCLECALADALDRLKIMWIDYASLDRRYQAALAALEAQGNIP